MKVSFGSMYRIPHQEMAKLSKDAKNVRQFDVLSLFLSKEGKEELEIKYDGYYYDIKNKYDKRFEATCKDFGVNAEKVNPKKQQVTKHEYKFCSPEEAAFYDVVGTLKDPEAEVIKTGTDKYGRAYAVFDDRSVVTYQKDGSKIIDDSFGVTFYVDKNDKVTRINSRGDEIIYFPNGSFLEISKKDDGKRGSDFMFYSDKYPKGMAVECFGEKDGKKVVNIRDYSNNRIVDCVTDGKNVQIKSLDDIMREVGCLADTQRPYPAEVLRAIALGKI